MIIDPSSFPNNIYCIDKTMKFLRPSKMNWMFCKKKKKDGPWNVFNLFFHWLSTFFCLQSWLFVLSERNIAKYILQTCCILKRKPFVLSSRTFKTFNIQLTICCRALLFVQLHDRWHFVHFHFATAVIALSPRNLK